MSKGYTLVEVVVAMLLTSIMVSSVFSVALSTKQGSAKSERRLLAAQVSRHMTNVLKNYVTADYSASCAIPGPNPNNPMSNRWSLSDTVVTDTFTGGLTNEYALRPGTHTVTGILPSWFIAAPYNGTLRYFVGTETSPQISVSVDWVEP